MKKGLHSFSEEYISGVSVLQKMEISDYFQAEEGAGARIGKKCLVFPIYKQKGQKGEIA